MFNDPANLAEVIAALQKAGKLPRGLSPKQIALIQKALQKYSGQVSQKVLADILADFTDKLQAATSLTDPAAMRGAVYDLTALVGDTEIAKRIKWGLGVSREVASGAGLYLNQNLSPEAVDEFPALEFRRAYERRIPRGEMLVKGELQEVPDEAWPARWAAAGDACGDDEWLPWEGDDQTGRGVALKSSGIWFALGDGAGGFTDTLSNPFAPFAFNSGFRTFDVSRAEAEKLGLLDEGESAKPARVDLSKLFAELTA